MIHPRAIREFVFRERDNHTWVKKLSHRQLDDELDRLGVRLGRTDKPLLLHQKACFLLGVAYPAFAHWLAMGGGKTRLMLELLRYWIRQKEVNCAFILVPSESVVISWENEIKQWNINLPFISLLNSPTAEKWDAIDNFDHGLIIGTYAGFTWLLSKRVKKPKGKGQQLVLDKKLVKRLTDKVDAFITDEATKLANKGSLIWKLANKVRSQCVVHYQLAGLPVGRDPMVLWAPLYLIDRGESLGDTLGLYRAAFFNDKPGYWGGTEYKFKKSMEPELARLLGHRSINYSDDECYKTPKVVHKIEEVHLPKDAKTYYAQFVKQLRAERAGFAERKNIFVRMRQVSSGYIGMLDEDEERVEIAFAHNPKAERLLELVDQVPRDRKFVIFYEFTYSGRLISKALKEAGIKHGWLWSGTKDVRRLQNDFDHDPDTRGLVVNHKKGAYGLNLQRGNYMFVYEAPVSAIDDAQMRKRLIRQGQMRTVFMFDLVCRGTVDTNILVFHREGRDLYKALIKNPGAVLATRPDSLFRLAA